MEVYNLDDVVTPSQLRATVAAKIRENANISNPKVRSDSSSSFHIFDYLFVYSPIMDFV